MHKIVECCLELRADEQSMDIIALKQYPKGYQITATSRAIQLLLYCFIISVSFESFILWSFHSMISWFIV